MNTFFENIIILIVFVGALAYLFNIVRKQFSSKNTTCAKNCGGACGAEIKIPEIKERIIK
jgi:hypothetical protein